MKNEPLDGTLFGPLTSDALGLFNLRLNDLDRISGLIFAAGLGIFFTATDETEETILLQQMGETTIESDARLNSDIARKLVNSNQLYVLASLISLYTTTERMKQLEYILPDTPSAEERKAGREMVTTANILALCSFMLAANGLELIADGTLKQLEETPPP